MASVLDPPATAAARAIVALLELLEEAGIEATRDAGAFHPRGVGVLVGLPSLAGRTLGARRFTIPVLVVSSDPLNTIEAVDALYTIADAIALALATDNYRPSSFAGSANAEPLPALELTITTSVEEV